MQHEGKVQQIFKLENPIKTYAWGSHSAIQDLLGLSGEARSGPMAELWMGAHPLDPSLVRLGPGERIPLERFIARDPEGVLGPPAARAFGGRLPFLFKVLAVRAPLSIQVHPDRTQAEEGFRRENASGLPPDHPARSYRDDAHKPELVCALTPFHALKGFRAAKAVLRLLRRAVPDSLAGEIRGLEERSDATGLREFMARILTLDPTTRERLTREALGRTQGKSAETGDPLGWIRRLAGDFPGDMGLLAPALMNLTVLSPGESLWIEAGVMHAYLSGTAAEIMANSDNVVRGGLTGKHVDVEELLRIARFRSEDARPMRPLAHGPGLLLHPADASEFLLARIRVSPERPFEAGPDRSVEIHLCLEGSGTFRAGPEGVAVEFARGDTLLVPASVSGYGIRGEAVLYRASVPGGKPDVA